MHGLMSEDCRKAVFPLYPLIDPIDPQYLSPLGWEHVNLTGDYLRRSSAKTGSFFRFLRRPLLVSRPWDL